MMKELRVGIIGLGFIGPVHLQALRKMPHLRVVGIADQAGSSVKEKADALGVDAWYENYEDLLARKDLDAVHICSPNHLHAEMVKKALLAGKHVVCEKPLAITSVQAGELVDLAAKKKLVNAVHFNIRYYPLIRQLKAMIKSGDMGRIFSIQGSYLQDWLFYDTDYNWRLESRLSGESRAVADIGSHWMDLVEYASGLRIKEVFADFATFHPIRKKPLKPMETYAGKILKPEDYSDVAIDTEDYATILFRFGNGERGVLTVSQVSAGRKNRLYFEIDGSGKSAEWDSETPNRMWIGRRDGPNELLMKDPSLVGADSRKLMTLPGGHQEGFNDTPFQLFREFYEDVRKGEPGANPSYPTFADGMREQVLCEHILESSRSGRWVAID
ncbi:MAG: Gfo/Idh/MocA family oxidoreductase [Rectinema sp.]